MLFVLAVTSLPRTAVAQDGVTDPIFKATATGSVYHVEARPTGSTGLVGEEVAFSGASVASAGLAQPYANEMQTVVHPPLSEKATYARGSGVETGGASGGRDSTGLARADASAEV